MKKLILTIGLSLGLGLNAPAANAGLLIGSASGNALGGAVVGATIGGTIVGLNLIGLSQAEDAGVALGLFTAMFVSVPLAFGLTLLDAESTIQTSDWVDAYKVAFPNVDNAESLETLALSTQSKLRQAIQADQTASQVSIHHSESELAEIFRFSDLSHEEFQRIVTILQ